ncbi:MAG: hypothetical protein EXS16_11035 [Gemmataceae bacterium]|nr:hypothetical protein [Gemmataceae bacterium]
MLGPHFYFDLIRLARHRRNLTIRCGYLLLMLAGLYVVNRFEPDVPRQINYYAKVAKHFTNTILFFEYLMVFLLTPIYFAGTIVEEEESGTLELLFMTHLRSHEILLGKYAARVVHLVFISMLGLPLLAIVSLWGGVDVPTLAMHFCLIATLIVLFSSACMVSSTMAVSHALSLVLSYAASTGVLGFFVIGGCIVMAIASFEFGSQALGIGMIVGMALIASAVLLFFACLRLHTLRYPTERPTTRRRKRAIPRSPTKPKPKPGESTARPVPDNALLWKELIDGKGAYQLAGYSSSVALTGFVIAGVANLFSKFPWAERGARDEFAGLSYFFFGISYGLSVAGVILLLAFRLTAVISREREQGTLRFLLLLPVERSEILWTKFIAPWIATHYLIATIVVAPIFALVTGIYAIRTCGVLLLLPWPSIIFAAGLALYLSVRCRRWVTANIVFTVVVVAVGSAHLFGGEYTRLFRNGFWMLLTGDFVQGGGLANAHPTMAVTTFLSHQATFAGIGVLLFWRAFAMFDWTKRNRSSQAPR